MEYTREKLIEICEKASVLEKDWLNRDTPNTQMKLGECWALLKAGCDFTVRTEKDFTSCTTDDQTIWLTVWHKTFSTFEDGSEPDDELYYLPTEQRLVGREGKDWY